MKHRKTFLGIGWKFPPTFDKSIGSVHMVSEGDDIKESIFILLSTKPGERVMNPDYGCAINSMMFEAITPGTVARLKKIIEDAIIYFESRVDVDEILVDSSNYLEGKILIDIHYTVKATNTRNNIVYPYYLIEGSEVQL